MYQCEFLTKCFHKGPSTIWDQVKFTRPSTLDDVPSELLLRKAASQTDIRLLKLPVTVGLKIAKNSRGSASASKRRPRVHGARAIDRSINNPDYVGV